jgi:hypothetical protein
MFLQYVRNNGNVQYKKRKIKNEDKIVSTIYKYIDTNESYICNFVSSIKRECDYCSSSLPCVKHMVRFECSHVFCIWCTEKMIFSEGEHLDTKDEKVEIYKDIEEAKNIKDIKTVICKSSIENLGVNIECPLCNEFCTNACFVMYIVPSKEKIQDIVNKVKEI